MKKLLLSLLLIPALGFSQNVYNYMFTGVTADLATNGWTRTNQSTSPSATTLWTIANYAPVVVSTATPATPFQTQVYTTGQTCPAPLGQDGVANGFALVNYTSTTSTAASGATISNWLISPIVIVKDGDIVSFYTRIGKYSATNMASFADNLQLRMSTNGALTTDPSAGPADVADYTNLLVEINPTFNLTSYPASGWVKYSYTVTGIPTPTEVKFGFRYYVTNGGVNGSNSDIIGIDSFSVDTPLSTDTFFKSNFAVYPNPVNDVVNITNITNVAINASQITDINGRIVKEVKGITSQINVSELNAGVYFLKITTDQGTGTTKIIKN